MSESSNGGGGEKVGPTPTVPKGGKQPSLWPLTTQSHEKKVTRPKSGSKGGKK
jgi:hypothetical protein